MTGPCEHMKMMERRRKDNDFLMIQQELQEQRQLEDIDHDCRMPTQPPAGSLNVPVIVSKAIHCPF